MSDGTRRYIDLLQWVEHHLMPYLFVSLDAKKAFDRVDWNFLKAVQEKFSFSGKILQAIMALYSNPSAKVVNSGMLSNSFRISKGTRQGCPLPPLIFALIMEPLAIPSAQIHLSPVLQLVNILTKSAYTWMM